MAKKIKDLPVIDFSCFCANGEDCVICNRPIYLIEQLLNTKLEGDPEIVRHRMENVSDDYMEGFMAALYQDPRTDKILKSKIS